MSYNGWTNWDTWESYGIITSNDEKMYDFIRRQFLKSDNMGLRSAKAYIKQHNRNLKKEELEHLIIDIDVVNFEELIPALKETMGVD